MIRLSSAMQRWKVDYLWQRSSTEVGRVLDEGYFEGRCGEKSKEYY